MFRPKKRQAAGLHGGHGVEFGTASEQHLRLRGTPGRAGQKGPREGRLSKGLPFWRTDPLVHRSRYRLYGSAMG